MSIVVNNMHTTMHMTEYEHLLVMDAILYYSKKLDDVLADPSITVEARGSMKVKHITLENLYKDLT